MALRKGEFLGWAFFLPLLLVLIYPFVAAYRDNLNNGYRTQVNTVEGQEVVLRNPLMMSFYLVPRQPRKLEKALIRLRTAFPYSLAFTT